MSDMKVEVVVIPVTDVDRARQFYGERLGWRLDADFPAGDAFRVVQLTPPVIFSLEECLDFIENDELLEVTPKTLRLRKKELDPNKRKRLNK